jgi:hypothetical protein
MRSGMETLAKAKVNQSREGPHVGDGDGIEGLLRDSNVARSNVSGHAIGGDHYAKDNHQTCYCEPDQAQAAMQVHLPSSDQREVCVISRTIQEVKTAPWM